MLICGDRHRNSYELPISTLVLLVPHDCGTDVVTASLEGSTTSYSGSRHCLMLFVDDDECLKTPLVCDINANCKNTLGSYLCSYEEGFKDLTVKHVKVKLKRKMAPYRKHHMLLIRAETFIVRGRILVPLISNSQLIRNKTIFLLFMLGLA